MRFLCSFFLSLLKVPLLSPLRSQSIPSSTLPHSKWVTPPQVTLTLRCFLAYWALYMPCTCHQCPDSLGVVCPLCLSTYLDGLASSPSALLAPAYSPLASQGLGPHLPAPPLPLGARGRLPPGPSSSLPPGEGGTKGPLSPQGWGWAACRLGPTSSFLEKMGVCLAPPLSPLIYTLILGLGR